MADGGASEMVMLITGLLTAGIVASLLVASWGSLAETVGDAQSEIEVSSRTRADLASDPSQISWNQTNCNLTFHVQNTGEIQLKADLIGVVVNGTAASVNQTQLLDGATLWLPGEVVELRVCPIGLNLVAGDEIPLIVVVRSVEYKGISGQYSFSEVIRIG
ncbi:MAG: hypothetical protein VX320_00060 [Candidatus Thermoplasmatota archaeon]|nr:hypothetical protein [Candidatus Thermoplasmatota archaeon]